MFGGAELQCNKRPISLIRTHYLILHVKFPSLGNQMANGNPVANRVELCDRHRDYADFKIKEHFHFMLNAALGIPHKAHKTYLNFP